MITLLIRQVQPEDTEISVPMVAESMGFSGNSESCSCQLTFDFHDQIPVR